MTKPIVVMTRHWTPRAEAAMAAAFDVRPNIADMTLSPDEILARCQGAMALCPTASDRVDGALIDALPDTVTLLACFGAGTDNIDLEAAARRGLVVSNTPDVVTEDTADLSFGLLIATCRRFIEGDALMRRGEFKGLAINFMLGTSIWGKTLGIVGLGAIGGAVARRARGFGMPVIYHNRSRNRPAEDALDAAYCETLEELLAAADIVSLHCPQTPETRHLIDAAALAGMKPGAVLINASRGAVVEEAALIAALKDGPLAAAGLDVYEFEPRSAAALRALPNTVLLPHLGTATREARDAMGLRVLANIEAFIDTGAVPDRVGA